MDQMNHASVTLTDENFDREVLQSGKPVLVDFWAPWCGPCQVVGPVVNELAREFQARVTVGQLNVDDHQQVAARYGIQSIPTLMIFHKGEIVDRMVGLQPKKVLAQKLDTVLKAA